LKYLSSDLGEIEELFGGDPWPFEIESNSTVLEELVNLLYDQGVISHTILLEGLFPVIYEQAVYAM
jgi:4,5-dihydroxyphthalate decarboxylase